MSEQRTASGLWVATGFNFLRHRRTVRTVTLPSGERAKVTVDDSGTVTHIEHGDRVDAIVRPKTVRLRPRIGG